MKLYKDFIVNELIINIVGNNKAYKDDGLLCISLQFKEALE